MNKKERKANQALKDATEYISHIQTQKLQPTPPAPVRVAPKPKPKPEPVKFEPQLYQGSRVDDYEIKKLKKGHFVLVITANGQRIEVPNRFKSTTKAREWISKYI
jgi:uncharacterized protein YegP (UPF0339 family)